MNSVVGFTIFSNLSEERVRVLQVAQDRALAYFPRLEKRSLVSGETHLEIWGHKCLDERIHTLPDGSLTVVIGSPHGKVNLRGLEDALLNGDFELPWDGRVIVLRISSDGRCWTMWNDWLGSIPVFHAQIGGGRVASTLEPVTVAAAGYTPDDFFMPGLVSLLINGHFISDWTLYKGMKTVLADSVAEWDENGFRAKQLWTVQPSQSRWEAGWDDLVDEMHELSYRAIADTLKTRSTWILPLSSGMDSRLTAGVAADVGANLFTYAWGAPETTDVVYSRQIAKILGLPWKHIEIPDKFLLKYTRTWADWFGSGLHFHGMYLMGFLDRLNAEPSGSVLSGLVGDTLAGDIVSELAELHHSRPVVDQVGNDWYVFWKSIELRSTMKVPIDEAINANAAEIKKMIDSVPGSHFQKLQFIELWGRQRMFIPYQSTLMDYWRGVANPFMDRTYARFCLSLPRAVLDDRRLQGEVFRRYYGRLAVIPGTYAKDPFILTGKYLFKRRIVEHLPSHLHHGPFAGFDDVPLRMDVDCVRVSGKDALWPLFEAWNQLLEWLDVELLVQAYQTTVRSKADIRPLRKLQSVQTLAYRLLKS